MVEKTEHDSHSLNMDYMQSLLPREHRGMRRKRKKNIYKREIHNLSQVAKVNMVTSNMPSHSALCMDTRWEGWHVTSVFSSQITQLHSDH